MKPVFVVGGLYSEANGVARIMRDLASALGRAGAPVTVYGAECFGRSSIGHIFDPPSRWIAKRGFWLGGLSWSPRLKHVMRDGIRQADVVHNHSVWMLPNSYGSRIAESTNKPVVITAHGTLEPWALSHARWKKRLAGLWFQDRDLRAADCIHVNSRRELESIRAYGLKCPVAVIPNGIRLEEFDPLSDARLLRDTFPELKNKRISLFMARLHQKKGLDLLLQAWSRLNHEFPDWHLVIAGPDCGFGRQARRLADELELDRSVTFTGNLQGTMRLAALSAADVFLHPSYSEGFSMAVLEALSCRLPALITPGCNFREASDAGAAVEVRPTVDDTEAGIRRLLALSDHDRANMGTAARRLIETHYTWDRVAHQTLDLYNWLSRGAPCPPTVELT